MEKFKDYMWHLIHYPLKVKKYTSNIYILYDVLGMLFDEIKVLILRIQKQGNILTATGRYLDLCGKDRNMPRMKNEDDENYRRRLLMKVEIAKRAGTKRGMELAIRSLGYEPEIEPVYKVDLERWAEFWVYLKSDLESSSIYDFEMIKSTVMEIKQASAKPFYGLKYVSKLEMENAQTYRIYNRCVINFYNTIYLYLDATWELDDSYKINGIKSGTKKDDYSTVRIITGIPVQIECGGEVEIDAIWYIDGTYLLDGSKILNGTVWREEL